MSDSVAGYWLVRVGAGCAAAARASHVRVGTSMGVDALGEPHCRKGEGGASVLAREEMVSLLRRACSRDVMPLEQRCTLHGAVLQLDELERERAWERRLVRGVVLMRAFSEGLARSTGTGSSTSSVVRSSALQGRGRSSVAMGVAREGLGQTLLRSSVKPRMGVERCCGGWQESVHRLLFGTAGTVCSICRTTPRGARVWRDPLLRCTMCLATRLPVALCHLILGTSPCPFHPATHALL